LGKKEKYDVVVEKINKKGIWNGIKKLIVKIRDEDKKKKMKGIKIGEIGKKLGMNEKNNG
jgi:hypothetical protein